MFFQGHGVAANSSHPQPPQHQNSHCTPTASSGGSSSSSLGSRMSYVSDMEREKRVVQDQKAGGS